MFWLNGELTARLANFEKVLEGLIWAKQLLEEREGETAHLKESDLALRYLTEMLIYFKINHIRYYIRVFLDLCCHV